MALNSSNPSFQNDHERGLRLYDYFVDFFAILLPGFFFLSILILLLGLQAYIYFFRNTSLPFPLQVPLQIVQSFRLELAMMFICASYLLGFMFFRRGPKEVDLRSIVTCWSEIVDDNPAVPITNKDKLSMRARIYLILTDYIGLLPLHRCKSLNDLFSKVQWPYQNLSKYLEARLPHLKSLVPWDPEDIKQTNEDSKQTNSNYKKQRTKTYMNILKNQIRFYLPDKYLTIARNEAHVRLSSSLWFVIVYLIRLAEANLLISIITWKFLHYPARYIIIYLLSVILLIVLKHQIQKFFYYQRMRELVFLLDTAFQALKTEPRFAKELIVNGYISQDELNKLGIEDKKDK